MTIYIGMAIAVAFSLRLGRGAIMAQMREHPGENGRRYTSTNAIKTALRKMPIHSYAIKRTTVGLASRKNGAQLCYDYAKKRAMPWWRIVVQILNTSPRDGIRYTEMWRQVSQKTILDSFGSRNLARCQVRGGGPPQKIPVSRYVYNEWGFPWGVKKSTIFIY